VHRSLTNIMAKLEETMAYAVARMFSGLDASGVDQASSLALKELAPKLAAAGGLIRYATVSYTNGRFGSVSVYDSERAAQGAAQIAADWTKAQPAMKGARLEETMLGEVVFSATGKSDQHGRLHGIARIYKTDASFQELKHAFETEAAETIRGFAGLARYTAIKLNDGRAAVLAAFDTAENGRKSSEQAKAARGRGAELARVLPSEPEVMEATVLGTYQKELVA